MSPNVPNHKSEIELEIKFGWTTFLSFPFNSPMSRFRSALYVQRCKNRLWYMSPSAFMTDLPARNGDIKKIAELKAIRNKTTRSRLTWNAIRIVAFLIVSDTNVVAARSVITIRIGRGQIMCILWMSIASGVNWTEEFSCRNSSLRSTVWYSRYGKVLHVCCVPLHNWAKKHTTNIIIWKFASIERLINQGIDNKVIKHLKWSRVLYFDCDKNNAFIFTIRTFCQMVFGLRWDN